MSNTDLRTVPPAERAQRCETCFCYRPDPKSLRQGLCCFEVPKAVPLANGGAMGIRPPVQATDFCVEHWTPTPEAKAAAMGAALDRATKAADALLGSRSEVRGQRSEVDGAGGAPGQPVLA